jgi:hypothetical protein
MTLEEKIDVEEVLSPFLENGTLQHTRIYGKNDSGSSIFVLNNYPIWRIFDFSIKEETPYLDMNEEYNNFRHTFLKLNNSADVEDIYSSIIFVIIFAKEEGHLNFIKNFPKTDTNYHRSIVWTSCKYEFVKDVEELLYPVNIKPAKRS